MSRFAVGDAVTFTNDYGVVFAGKKVIALDESKWSNPEPRYFIAPTDTPWFSFPERNLSKAGEGQE